MKILTVVTVYTYEPELLRQSMLTYAHHVDKVFICDNNPNSVGDEYNSIASEFSNVRIIVNHSNDGISKPFNRIWRENTGKGYDYLMTMDQDSTFDDFKLYIECVSKYKGEPAIITPNYNHNFDFKEGETLKPLPKFITSGTLFPFPILEELDGFCEDFLVDGIDIDFAIKATRAGYKILCCRDGNIKQRFGNPIEYTFFGRKLIGSEYNTRRLHDIFRNQIIILRRYKYPKLARKLLFDYFKRLVTCIVVAESNKARKLMAITKGIHDGIVFRI